MTSPAPRLTLLVPCFNEGARIDRFVEAVEAWRARRLDVDLEVLFVDDGSSDDTRVRLEAVARRLPGVRLLARDVNGGKGAALRDGMAAARGETVLFLDADLAVGLDHVNRALALREAGAELVVGCRNVPGAIVQRRQGLARRCLGRGYRRMARWWLGLHVADVTCGFKAFRRDVGQTLFAASRASRWGFDAEVLYLAQRAEHSVRELPVQWFDGDVSAVRLRRDVGGALRELAVVRWRHRARHTAGTAPQTGGVSAGHVSAGPLQDG